MVCLYACLPVLLLPSPHRGLTWHMAITGIDEAQGAYSSTGVIMHPSLDQYQGLKSELGPTDMHRCTAPGHRPALTPPHRKLQQEMQRQKTAGKQPQQAKDPLRVS